LQTSVATLLLVTATVVLACAVVNYTVNVFEQYTTPDGVPQLGQLKSLESTMLNQTNALLNDPQLLMPDQQSP
jgi:hypothetical protein